MARGRNGAVEYQEAIAARKPLICVHEVDPKKGGASLEEMLDECPAELRSRLLQSRHIVVPWLRAPSVRRSPFAAPRCFAARPDALAPATADGARWLAVLGG